MMESIDMKKSKRLGVLLIIIGVFIPSILYPFTSVNPSAFIIKGFFASKGVAYNTSFRDLEIVLIKEETKKYNKNAGDNFEGRYSIPFKFILAFGIMLAFTGIGIVAFQKDRKKID